MDIHLVLDNYVTHKVPKVAVWFQPRPRYYWPFTPTSSSWLNQVEWRFAKITGQHIRRGVFKHVDELITATAELILDRVTTLCQRTNRSPQ